MSILDSPLLEEHRYLVKERVNELSKYINNGLCSTFDEYKKKTGVIEGLKLSIDLMTKASKTYTDDNEDDF